MFQNTYISKTKVYAAIIVSMLFISACAVCALTPTEEEVIQSQIEFNGAEWAKWDEVEQSALETIERAREAKNALHVQTESLRAFFQ